MLVTCPCPDCHTIYDDEHCWATCPHGPLWAPPDKYCREHDLINCPFHGTKAA